MPCRAIGRPVSPPGWRTTSASRSGPPTWPRRSPAPRSNREAETMRRVLAALACLLVLGSCARRQTPAEAGRANGTLLLGNGAEPQDLDPQICTAYTDYNVLIALFEGLTCIDEATSQAVPGMARS